MKTVRPLRHPRLRCGIFRMLRVEDRAHMPLSITNTDIHCLFYSGLLGIVCLFDFDVLIFGMCLIVGGLYAVLTQIDVLCNYECDYNCNYDCNSDSCCTAKTVAQPVANTNKPFKFAEVTKLNFIHRPSEPEPKKTFANCSESDKAIVLDFYEKITKSAIESKTAVEINNALLTNSDIMARPSSTVWVTVPEMFPHLLERLKVASTDAWVLIPSSETKQTYMAVPVVVAATAAIASAAATAASG